MLVAKTVITCREEQQRDVAGRGMSHNISLIDFVYTYIYAYVCISVYHEKLLPRLQVSFRVIDIIQLR